MKKLFAALLMTYSSSVVTFSYEETASYGLANKIGEAREKLAQELLCDADSTRWYVVKEGDAVLIWGTCSL